MFKKRFLYEQEENKEVELNDFQKILALNKRKIDIYDVEFFNSEGKDYSEFIDIDYDGIHFKFDGLKEFLGFFFPDYYAEGSDGEWDASSYESMYSGNWSWYDEFDGRYSDDWEEGYVIQSFNGEDLKRLKEILDFASPQLSNKIKDNNNGILQVSDSESKNISDLLSTLGLEGDIFDAYIDGRVSAVSDSSVKYIEKTYCNCLTDLGIENDSQRYCFWKYTMDWGSAILLFVRFGTENDNFLDLLFEALQKTNVKHLPEYYEMEHYAWDDDEFHRVFSRELNRIFDKFLENIEDSEFYNKKYLEVINKVASIGGVGDWIKSKNKKFQIRINSIDPETLKIDFNVAGIGNNWSYKKGRSSIDNIINLLNNESLFDVQDFREHYLKLLQKTVL